MQTLNLDNVLQSAKDKIELPIFFNGSLKLFDKFYDSYQSIKRYRRISTSSDPSKASEAIVYGTFLHLSVSIIEKTYLTCIVNLALATKCSFDLRNRYLQFMEDFQKLKDFTNGKYIENDWIRFSEQERRNQRIFSFTYVLIIKSNIARTFQAIAKISKMSVILIFRIAEISFCIREITLIYSKDEHARREATIEMIWDRAEYEKDLQHFLQVSKEFFSTKVEIASVLLNDEYENEALSHLFYQCEKEVSIEEVDSLSVIDAFQIAVKEIFVPGKITAFGGQQSHTVKRVLIPKTEQKPNWKGDNNLYYQSIESGHALLKAHNKVKDMYKDDFNDLTKHI